jgi:hypothetical protein
MTHSVRILRRLFLAGAALALLASAASAAQSLNGAWDLLSTDTPHGELRFQVTFTEGAGTALSAEVLLFDQKIEMSGERKGDAFAVRGAHAGGDLALSGKVRGDGTLEGFLSSERGDLIWTGTRAKQ